MSTDAVIVTLSLLAQIYGADPALTQCISWYESGHDVTAVNGNYIGALQLGSEFWADLTPRYLSDETAPHREYVRTHNDRRDPVAGMIVGTWALAHGYRDRWSANRFCWEVGK